jgi:hypothetical protein
MFAQTIKAKGNIVVLVTSEGGRGREMQDSKSSFGMVMGPRSVVDSGIIGDLEALSRRDSIQTVDPANESAGHRLPSGLLLSPNGSPISGLPNVGDLQVGVVRALAQQIGFAGSLTELGNYLKLRK